MAAIANRLRLRSASKLNNVTHRSIARTAAGANGARPGGPGVHPTVPPLVCTSMLNVVPALPAATLPGINVAVAPAGSPLTENVTAKGNVAEPTGASANINVAVPPAVTVWLDEPLPPPRLKSCTASVTVALAVV